MGNRMDVKSCLPKPARMVKKWKQEGVAVATLGDYVEYVDFDQMPDEDVVITDTAGGIVTFLRVKYNGFPEEGDEVSPSDTNYPKLFRVHTGDIVLSNINAVHGAIAVIPEEFDGLVVSHEFTICRAKNGRDPRLIWSLLRSPQMRADLLLMASGIGRHRVQWENVVQLMLPVPATETTADVVQKIAQAEEQERVAARLRQEAQSLLESAFHLNTTTAQNILAAFKPPK